MQLLNSGAIFEFQIPNFFCFSKFGYPQILQKIERQFIILKNCVKLLTKNLGRWRYFGVTKEEGGDPAKDLPPF